jgi:4'-phosphopantetheinyl transferase
LRGTLAPDELTRAARFRFGADRLHYVVARGWLRAVLGSYLGMEPAELRFAYGPSGKPRLSVATGGAWLRFNLSHSDGRALCAVATGREVGIDLERIRGDRDHDAMAEHLFSPREVSELTALPAEKQAEAFHKVWTRKEAFAKATGDGLSLPLNRFDLSSAAGEPSVVFPERDAPPWSIHALDAWPGYAAALAVQGQDVRIRECSP